MLILLGAASCNQFDTEDDLKVITPCERTVLVYMAADNNLSSYLQGDINEMLEGATDIPNNCRLLVYIDDHSLPRIISIKKENGKPITKTLLQYSDEHDSGDVETLRMVMQWITENSPARSYGLVLWSHGTSWVPSKAPAQRAICVDSRSGGTWMEIEKIAEVMKQFPHLEFILFDACFMQAIEVAYELREVTDYIISSPAEIPGPGAPYHRLVAPIFSQPTNADSIAKEYYLEYKENNIYVQGYEPDCFGVCLSVIDCNQLESLATVTNEMLQKYTNPESSVKLSGVQQYYPYTNSASTPEYYDMNGYMRLLIADPVDYARWRSALDAAVPSKYTTDQWFSSYARNNYGGLLNVDTKNYGGISCYVPKAGRTKLNTAFQSTTWYNAAGWKQIGW